MSTCRTGTGPLTAAELEDWYAVPLGRADGTWVRAGLVTSLDGRAAGPDGLSGSLNRGSAGDHAVFDHLRRWADVVVVGAGTVRDEGYGPLPAVPLVVVSRSGDVPARLRRAAESGTRDGPAVVVLDGHGEDVDPGRVLTEVASRGWRRVLLEGGPQLLGTWLEADAVDELCATVRPVLVGGDGPLLVPRSTSLRGPVGSTTHLLAWEGDVLVRTRLR
ncbi:dihydrofolate reductase family protein [Ornithinimicrobium sp. LYQ103]|uniref:dihydrofolate reductase family protein n=1 Tax=Ornithinimicrobium sp. LYQ103 TaxID=3378796 RepID=UPI003854A2C2